MARVRVKIKDIPPAEKKVPAQEDSPAPQNTSVDEEPATLSAAEHQVSPEPIPFDSPEQPSYPEPSHQAASSDKGITISRRMLLIAGAAFVIILTATVVLVRNGDTPGQSTANVQAPASAVQADADKYNEEVSKYVELPQNQAPQLVVVSDAPKLAERLPALFKSTQKDDVVLFYTNPDKTTKAVLYRPSAKKIITVVDGITPGDSASTTTPASKPAR